MANLALPVAVSLAVCAALSLLLSTWPSARLREGKIKLPLHEDANGNGAYIHGPNDPFDVVEPQDIVEGYPIEPEKFWKNIRLWKIFIVILVAFTVILEAVSLGTSCLEADASSIATYALRVAFSVYLLLLIANNIPEEDTVKNRSRIIHGASLASLASLLLFADIIVPEGPPPARKSLLGMSLDSPSSLDVAATCLYILTAANLVSIPHGPPLHYPPEQIYSLKTLEAITNQDQDNVTGAFWASISHFLFFSYTTKVVNLGNTAESLEIGDLPILPTSIRSTFNYRRLVDALRRTATRSWKSKPGVSLAWSIILCNKSLLLVEVLLAAVSGMAFYIPAFFMRQLILYIELDPERISPVWGWVFVAGIYLSSTILYIVTAQLWSVSTSYLACQIKSQVNSVLFKKTLTRKDVAAASASDDDKKESNSQELEGEKDFATKGQVFTLFTTDVERVSSASWYLFTIVDAPIEIIVGTVFLYKLLGVSCLVGLACTFLFVPFNHWGGKVMVGAQDKLMKRRDERVALMNEILGAIRMLKFMAWERSFEARVMKIRGEELKYQRLSFIIEAIFTLLWLDYLVIKSPPVDRYPRNVSPVVVTLMSFWHYAAVRGQPLTPAIAFPSMLVFTELKYALNVVPETLVHTLQSWVSLKRVEKYLASLDVAMVPPIEDQSSTIAFQSCTVTWPQDRGVRSSPPSSSSTPRQSFCLFDLNLDIPLGELTLICGKIGSGKTLLLLSLLGESDVLAGQVLCPRSPPDSLAKLSRNIAADEAWVVQGMCAYVPQTVWLQNASIRDNILFGLPYNESRYQKTLEVCALLSDLEIIEDGDEAEIGERGVNLSGGQKARVFLDDVLSAVDAHTAHHLYHLCLKGDLMMGRTVILVSHHVQLCADGAKYVIALENGQTAFAGDAEAFKKSPVLSTLIQSHDVEEDETNEKEGRHETVENEMDKVATSSDASTAVSPVKAKKPPRKLVSEEKRAVGHIESKIYKLYTSSFGGVVFWTLFVVAFLAATLVPVADNSWMRYWSNSILHGDLSKSTMFFIGIYAVITLIGTVLQTLRYLVLYHGSITASAKLYQKLLNAVLFTTIRFHDTVSRGRLLNRFGKDFEGIDSELADNLGRTLVNMLNVITTFVTVAVIGGPIFLVPLVILALLYFQAGKGYGQASRDMRRLDSVTRSPLYSLYGETISGVALLRAFGAPSKFMRDMLSQVDTNSTPYFWLWGVNRWVSIRFNLVSAALCGITAAVCLANKRVDSAFAGFALAFVNTIGNDVLFMVRRFVQMEQSMVALERVKEYSDLPAEGPEHVEPRPDPAWPHEGHIKCEQLVVKYAPELPSVLHGLNFEIQPGERVGILGRTGSGKSTLALSFFRFVEATEGRILIDNKDISSIGLADLRGRLTIIPQDPSILGGTVRNTLDVWDEYDDAEIYEALRRVHLLPPTSSTSSPSSTPSPSPPDGTQEVEETINANVFRNLDAPVSEGGENFSTGEKQLICMARAILRRSKVLVMDEATASVDYATDELISQTIRDEFRGSTILTIAHRLRTVIDYDRVMLLDQGRIVEFDTPQELLKNTSSKFYQLCKATGKDEFAMLKKMAKV